MSSPSNSSRRSSQWARVTWKRAFEGALILPTFDDSGGTLMGNCNDGVLLDVQALDIDDDVSPNKTKTLAQDLKFVPRQSIYTRLQTLITKMQDSQTGLDTTNQSFKAICETWSKTAPCAMKADCSKAGVPDAFTTTSIVQWLMTNLDITAHLEACHLATMLCRTGYIYPCNVQWNTKTIRIHDPDEAMLCRFQAPFYWPTATLTANETDHASYLVSRQTNCHGVPLDDYETKYLSKVEKVLSHQWSFITKTSAIKEKLMSRCCMPDQYIKAWQEYAYWKVHRPQCYQKCLGSRNSDNWNVSLRGLNRNFSSYKPEKSHAKKDKKKVLGKSPTKVLKASCNRIVTSCVTMEAVDPLLEQSEGFYNPWKNDSIRNAWPIAASEETGPYRMQCKSWGLNFDVMLRDDLGQCLFEQFLKKEFSDENLSFYCECVYLRSAPLSEVDECIKSIFNEFISPSGSSPVNIDTQTLNQVKQEMRKSKSRYTFDVALDHIYALMKKDSYKRFLSSNIYNDAMARSKDPRKPEKEKMKLPRIWRMSQFLPKNKPVDMDVEKGEG